MSIATSSTPGLRAPSIEDVKARYSVADAWRDEACPGSPGRSCRTPWRADKHPSFSVYGDGQRWKDHASGDGGDVLDFLVKARGCTPAEALAVARERVGCRPGAQSPALSHAVVSARPTMTSTTSTTSSAAPAYKPVVMDGDVRLAWEAGLHWLAKVDVKMQAQVDVWRAWPEGTTRRLALQGLLSAPEWKGQRSLAWLVQYPGRYAWFPVGWHLRHKPRREGERAVWTYAPSGVGLPGVPLVLGNFYRARLVVVCEGEWDAVTFAAAAGWLASDSAWPDAVAVLGIRGATGWRSYIEHWRRCWPRRPRFLLIPDNDEAGLKWHREFAGALAPLALSVTVKPPTPGGPKDLNDLHREEPFTPAEIYGLLRDEGLMDANGRPQ